MKRGFMSGALCLALVLVVTSLWAADAPLTTAPSGGEPEVSLTEINKKLTNPVSDLWSIAFQQNNYMLDMGAANRTAGIRTSISSPFCL